MSGWFGVAEAGADLAAAHAQQYFFLQFRLGGFLHDVADHRRGAARQAGVTDLLPDAEAGARRCRLGAAAAPLHLSSDRRRVGDECVSTWRSRGAPDY